jgi:phosphoribulokinase
MSAQHPIIAVTGSSGAGTTTTSLAFRKIFHQLNIHAAELEGDSFHHFTRPEMIWAAISVISALKPTTLAYWQARSFNTA